MSMEGWQPLACDCGSQEFTQVARLSFHETQGSSSRPDGWQCAGCGKRAPMSAMVERAKRLSLQKKIEELNGQL